MQKYYLLSNGVTYYTISTARRITLSGFYCNSLPTIRSNTIFSRLYCDIQIPWCVFPSIFCLPRKIILFTTFLYLIKIAIQDLHGNMPDQMAAKAIQPKIFDS